MNGENSLLFPSICWSLSKVFQAEATKWTAPTAQLHHWECWLQASSNTQDWAQWASLISTQANPQQGLPQIYLSYLGYISISYQSCGRWQFHKHHSKMDSVRNMVTMKLSMECLKLILFFQAKYLHGDLCKQVVVLILTFHHEEANYIVLPDH